MLSFFFFFFFFFKQKTAYELMPSLVGSENVYQRQCPAPGPTTMTTEARSRAPTAARTLGRVTGPVLSSGPFRRARMRPLSEPGGSRRQEGDLQPGPCPVPYTHRTLPTKRIV